jgi:hypothetical protein
MAVRAKQSEQEAIRSLERTGEKEIAESEIVVGVSGTVKQPIFGSPKRPFTGTLRSPGSSAKS